MVAKEKLIAGALSYIDREVLPHLPELKAIAVAGVVTLYAQKAPDYITNMEKAPAVQALGVIKDGIIDEDAIYNAFAPKIRKPLEINIPFVGKLSVDRAEIDKLLRYIKEA